MDITLFTRKFNYPCRVDYNELMSLQPGEILLNLDRLYYTVYITRTECGEFMVQCQYTGDWETYTAEEVG